MDGRANAFERSLRFAFHNLELHDMHNTAITFVVEDIAQKYLGRISKTDSVSAWSSSSHRCCLRTKVTRTRTSKLDPPRRTLCLGSTARIGDGIWFGRLDRREPRTHCEQSGAVNRS